MWLTCVYLSDLSLVLLAQLTPSSSSAACYPATDKHQPLQSLLYPEATYLSVTYHTPHRQCAVHTWAWASDNTLPPRVGRCDPYSPLYHGGRNNMISRSTDRRALTGYTLSTPSLWIVQCFHSRLSRWFMCHPPPGSAPHSIPSPSDITHGRVYHLKAQLAPVYYVQ